MSVPHLILAATVLGSAVFAPVLPSAATAPLPSPGPPAAEDQGVPPGADPGVVHPAVAGLRSATTGPSPQAPAGRAKPLSAGVVVLDPDAVGDGRVTVTADPVPGLAETSVVFSATGDARITATDGPVSSEAAAPASTGADLEVTPGPEPADPVAAVLADATGTTVRATLRGVDGAGRPVTSSDTLWVDDLRGRTIASASGELDLRLRRVDVLEDEGELGAAEAAALRERILGGGAATTQSVVPGTCVDLCLQGTVAWTDAAGGTHPVDRAPVEIRDEDGAVDEVVTTVLTDAEGHFEATIDNDDGDATGRDVYVRVRADGPGFTFAQHLDSGVDTDVPTGSVVTQDLTANATDDNNTAFSVRAALVVGADAIVDLHGGLLPEISVEFPDPEGSYYDGDALHLLRGDRFDWDVVLHEYGHHVADQVDIEDNPGGRHRLSENLSDARGKPVGIRLAWGEGWPTYFAVSLQAERAAGLGIPNVADVRYQDGEDATIDVSLEARATLGEDNERTVANVLWDLYDTAEDWRDRVALGEQAVWDGLTAVNPTTLSEAVRPFTPNRRIEAVNCVLTDMNVAPRLDGPATVTAPTVPPRLSWRRGNGGSYRNDRFSVTVRAASGRVLAATNFGPGQSFTPTPAQWRSWRTASEGALAVSVVGRQTAAPRTGDYRSCTRTFTVA